MRLAAVASLLFLATWAALVGAPVQAQVQSRQAVPAETKEQQCVRAPSRACVLDMARALADRPGLLNDAERAQFEATIVYADRPERLLARGLPVINFGADWPTLDREVFDALITAQRYDDAIALLDRWTDQFRQHDSKIVRDAFLPG